MQRRHLWLIIVLLTSAGLSACTVSNRGLQGHLIAHDRLLSSGDIQVAQEHLKGLGFDPGPINGIFTEQTAEAVRQYQRRYGLVVSGLLDLATREELIPGLDGGGDDDNRVMLQKNPR